MKIILIIFLIVMIGFVLYTMWSGVRMIIDFIKTVWPYKSVLFSYYLGRLIHPSCAHCETCALFMSPKNSEEGECLNDNAIRKSMSLCSKWKSRVARTEVERILSRGW